METDSQFDLPLTVHFQQELSAAERDQFFKWLNLGDRQVPLIMTSGPSIPDSPSYQILVAGRPTREELATSPRLTTLIIPWAGLPVDTRSLLLDFPHINVHNLHHNDAAVTELAMMLLLAAAKLTIPFDKALRSGDWRLRYAQPTPSVSLSGKTALVLGYGAIGRRVARACQALGMHVHATRRRATEMQWVDEQILVHPATALESLLPKAQAIMVCLPHTPETDGLLGERELMRVPFKCVLVNVGRAQIVDETALYRALRDGVLYAAGLDVWYSYPPDEASRIYHRPSAHPFHELENVVMSPHRAGAAEDTDRLRMTELANLLVFAVEGRPLPNRVDVVAGY